MLETLGEGSGPETFSGLGLVGFDRGDICQTIDTFATLYQIIATFATLYQTIATFPTLY